MRTETPVEGPGGRAKTSTGITTMRVRRTTLTKLAARQRELGSSSLNEALETILFRQRAYEAISRLEADPSDLAAYQREAQEWAEVDVEPRG